MMKEKSDSILFFLRRIGPYHHARFQALAKKVNLIAVETRPGSQEYAWNFQAKGDYRIHSFPVTANPERGLRGAELNEEITALIRDHQPSVIATTGWADAEYHAVVLGATRYKIPVLLISDSRYEDEPRHWPKELLKRWIIKSYSSALVAGYFKQELFSTAGVCSGCYFFSLGCSR
jgi:hypothetical protein